MGRVLQIILSAAMAQIQGIFLRCYLRLEQEVCILKI